MIRVRAGCGRGVVSHPSALNRGAAQGRPDCGRPFVSAGRCGRGRCHTLSQSGPRPRGLGRAPIFPGPGRAAGGLGHRPGRNVSPPPLATFRSRTVVWGSIERGSVGSRPENRPRGGTSPTRERTRVQERRERPLPVPALAHARRTRRIRGTSAWLPACARRGRGAAPAPTRAGPAPPASVPHRPRPIRAAYRRRGRCHPSPASPHRRCRLWIRCGL